MNPSPSFAWNAIWDIILSAFSTQLGVDLSVLFLIATLIGFKLVGADPKRHFRWVSFTTWEVLCAGIVAFWLLIWTFWPSSIPGSGIYLASNPTLIAPPMSTTQASIPNVWLTSTPTHTATPPLPSPSVPISAPTTPTPSPAPTPTLPAPSPSPTPVPRCYMNQKAHFYIMQPADRSTFRLGTPVPIEVHVVFTLTKAEGYTTYAFAYNINGRSGRVETWTLITGMRDIFLDAQDDELDYNSWFPPSKGTFWISPIFYTPGGQNDVLVVSDCAVEITVN